MKSQQPPYQTQQYKEDIQDSAQIYPIQQLQTQVLSQTIIADITTNKKFLIVNIKATIWLLLIVMFLKILPSPIIIQTFQNDPNVFTKQICNDENCENTSSEGFQSVTIKKINPLHRELKYFVRINQAKMGELVNIFQKSKMDLDEQLTWIQIYALRNNDIYGEAIYEKSGKDVYEVIFNNQPLIFVGEVHILTEVSYIIRIYKLVHKYKSIPTLRLLDQNNTSNSNQTKFNDQNNSTENSQTNQTKETNQTNQSNQTSQTNQTNQTSQNNQTSQSNQTSQNNETQTNKNETKQVLKQISVPLTIQLVRYSQFYTGIQLLIRYVTLLIILYVAAQTSNCPKIFRIILFFTSNPLIFTEIAFPNTASNIISNMCSSMYVLYVPIFLFYTHRKLPNFKLDILVKTLKFLISLGLYIATVARSMHLINQSFVENIQYLLIAAVMVPIVKYFWRMYFVRSKVVLHRDMLFVVVTLYYFSLLFFSGYIVQYGWKKINFYLIVQSYGVALCFLTSPNIRNKKKKDQQISSLSPNPQLQQQIPSNQSNHGNSIEIEPTNSAKAQQKYKEQMHVQQLFVKIQ